MALKDTQKCKAKTKRTGERCNNPAVKGRSVCRLHGGAGGRPLIHGLRSKELPVKLEEQRQELINNREQLLSLEPMIATLKVRLDAFEKLKTEAGGNWDEKEIRLLTDTSEAISRIIEKVHKIEIANKEGVPAEQVRIFINRLIYILTSELDTEKLEKIKEKIAQAALETMPINSKHKV